MFMRSGSVNRKNIAAAAVSVSVLVLIAVFVLCVKPSIKLIGEKTETVEVYDRYSDSGAKARFIIKNISDKITVDAAAVDTNTPGDYTVVYSVSYFGKTSSVTRTVSVKDSERPAIALIGEDGLRFEDISQFEDPGARALDNVDGDISDKIGITCAESRFTEGERSGETEYVFTYTVTDSSGNESSVTRTVVIKDETPPTVSLKGEEVMNVVIGQQYTDPGIVAEDNVSKEPEVFVSGEVNTAVAGEYVLRYTAVDEAGNSASVERRVKVRDVLPFVKRGQPLKPGESYISLTFDDGPSENTIKVLDILDKYGVKATFFILNYSERYVPVLQRMVNGGHTVAIHSYSHDFATIYTSPDAYMNGVYTMQDKIYKDTGYTANVLRFPGGSSNTLSRRYCTGVMAALAERVDNSGFVYFDWDIDSGDADGYCMPVEHIKKNVMGSLRKGRNNVVLMHDTAVKDTTVEALPAIIEDALNRGFTFVPLSPAVDPVHHRINN